MDFIVIEQISIQNYAEEFRLNFLSLNLSSIDFVEASQSKFRFTA